MTNKISKNDFVCKCRKCGNQVTELYQHNTCKSCLLDSFVQLRKVIDFHRARENRKMRAG